MSTRTRLAAMLGAVAALAALSCAGASADRGVARLPWDSGFFLVQPQDDDSPELDLSLSLPDPSARPARITFYVPRGFPIYPQRPAGSPIGAVELYAADYTAGTAGVTFLAGQIVAQPVGPQTEADVQSCSPGSHLALWQLTLNMLGQPLAIPMAISSAGVGDQSDSELRVDVCPPPLPPSGTPLPIASIELSLWDLEPPPNRGSYRWRAVITPLAPDQRTPLPERALELQSVVPVPQTLRLLGRYNAASQRVTLHGSLREAGKPAVGVRIWITKLVRKVTRNGVTFNDSTLAVLRTNAAGVYSLTRRLTATAGFVASTGWRLRPCPGSNLTATGCRNQTTPASRSEPITISVPSRHH